MLTDHHMQPRVKFVSSEVLRRVVSQAMAKGFRNDIDQRMLDGMSDSKHAMVSVYSRHQMVGVEVHLRMRSGEIVPVLLDLDFQMDDSIVDEGESDK